MTPNTKSKLIEVASGFIAALLLGLIFGSAIGCRLPIYGHWQLNTHCWQFIDGQNVIQGSVCPFVHDDFYVCRGDGSCLNNVLTVEAGKHELEDDMHFRPMPK